MQVDALVLIDQHLNIIVEKLAGLSKKI